MDWLLVLGVSEEVVSVTLETLVLKVSSSVLLDCPSSASNTVLGERVCVLESEIKSFKTGEASLSL